ncbi:MAG: hypothetical protein HQL45_05685 [Alphaproteobacteria bacterium]|nr:hypothetical protein [Alphaproteobacteria bacterium]
MTLKLLLSFSILMAFNDGPAFAGEIKTSCPLRKQGNPEIRFHYGEPYPDGYPTRTEADRENNNKGLRYVVYEFASYRTNKAVLMCEFKDRSRIEIPIPGYLIRCGKTINDIDPRKPTEWLDVWCISDDAQVPAPEQK